MTGDRWLSLPEAAVRVGRSQRTIRRWIESRHLTPILGRVRESTLLEADALMRSKIGRPRKLSS